MFLPITLVIKKIKNKKRLRNILRNINEFILKNVGNIRKTVIIFQSLFFDTNGKHFYAGGAERYCLDMADIIHKTRVRTVADTTIFMRILDKYKK